MWESSNAGGMIDTFAPFGGPASCLAGPPPRDANRTKGTSNMALTEDGLGVADGVRGRVQMDLQPGEVTAAPEPASPPDVAAPVPAATVPPARPAAPVAPLAPAAPAVTP